VIAELATVQRSPVAVAMLRLCRELERYGITADAHEGDEVAALSVAYGLVISCEYGPDGSVTAGGQGVWHSARDAGSTPIVPQAP
jgi:hypothetical protein